MGGDRLNICNNRARIVFGHCLDFYYHTLYRLAGKALTRLSVCSCFLAIHNRKCHKYLYLMGWPLSEPLHVPHAIPSSI